MSFGFCDKGYRVALSFCNVLTQKSSESQHNNRIRFQASFCNACLVQEDGCQLQFPLPLSPILRRLQSYSAVRALDWLFAWISILLERLNVKHMQKHTSGSFIQFLDLTFGLQIAFQQLHEALVHHSKSILYFVYSYHNCFFSNTHF